METINLPRIPRWNIEELTGYKPKTTFWEDFSIADRFGIAAVKDTYRRAKKEWGSNAEYWTELSMVLNHKTCQHYPGRIALAKAYDTLWRDSQSVVDEWNDEDRRYYYQVTD